MGTIPEPLFEILIHPGAETTCLEDQCRGRMSSQELSMRDSYCGFRRGKRDLPRKAIVEDVPELSDTVYIATLMLQVGLAG